MVESQTVEVNGFHHSTALRARQDEMPGSQGGARLAWRNQRGAWLAWSLLRQGGAAPGTGLPHCHTCVDTQDTRKAPGLSLSQLFGVRQRLFATKPTGQLYLWKPLVFHLPKPIKKRKLHLSQGPDVQFREHSGPCHQGHPTEPCHHPEVKFPFQRGPTGWEWPPPQAQGVAVMMLWRVGPALLGVLPGADPSPGARRLADRGLRALGEQVALRETKM